MSSKAKIITVSIGLLLSCALAVYFTSAQRRPRPSINEAAEWGLKYTPSISWHDPDGDFDTAIFYFNGESLGVGREGFERQLACLRELPARTHIYKLMPFNQYYDVGPDLSVPISRNKVYRDEFYKLSVSKQFSFTIHEPDLSRIPRE